MTARKIVIAMSILMLASVCWGQYSTSFHPQQTDITSYLPTTNAWKAMPTKNLISMTITRDWSIYVLDTSGCGWAYSTQTRTYTQQAAWGCGWSKITGKMYSGVLLTLLKTSGSCTGGRLRVYRAFPAQAPADSGLCASTWAGSSSDDAEMQINLGVDGHTHFYTSTSYLDLGTGWTAGSVSSSTKACATKMDGLSGHLGRIYTLQNGQMTLFSPQPPYPNPGKGFGGATECTMDSNVMLASGYMWTGTAWVAVSGGATGIVGPEKAALWGLISSHPYHLNVYAGYISGNTTGSVNVCPDAAHPCTQGATHTGTLQVHLLHGLSGQPVNQTAAPTAGINITSFDFSPQWDMAFGPPGDPEGQPSVSGQVVCNVSGATLAVALQPTVTTFNAVTRTSVNVDNASCTNSWSLACGSTPSCGYYKERGFTNYCDGGTQNPDYQPTTIVDCNTDGTDITPGPPDGLWGFDVSTPCVNVSIAGHGLITCFTNPITDGPLLYHRELIQPTPPFATPGFCTFNGVTE